MIKFHSFIQIFIKYVQINENLFIYFVNLLNLLIIFLNLLIISLSKVEMK